MSAKKTVVIIGAGVGGLGLANILAKAGLNVHVYEKNGEPGGRMGRIESDGYTYDTGPSWYLMKEVFEEYFKLFNKEVSDYYELERLDPAYKVFYEGSSPVTITGDFKTSQNIFETLEKGAGRELDRYIRNGEKNYHAALRYFLYNPFKQPLNLLRIDTLRSLPAFIPVFTQTLHGYVSRRFKKQELQQIMEYPSVFLGSSPFDTPALYQLMSYLDFREGVFYPKKKGMYAVTEALCSLGTELGVTYHFNSEVSRILVKNGTAQGVTVEKNNIAADIVVSNADLHFTETSLLSPEWRSYPDQYWQKRKAGPSALLLYLGVKGSLPELEHHNLFFVRDWQKNFDQIYKDAVWPDAASIYVSRTTATDNSTAPEGHENIFVLVPLPAGVTLPKAQTKEYIDRYLKQLEIMSGISDLCQRITHQEVRTPTFFNDSFHAWQNTALGMSHTLRQSAFLRPSIQSKKVRNLYYVGAGTQPGIGVPICLISSQIVYKYLVKDWSPGAPKHIREITV